MDEVKAVQGSGGSDVVVHGCRPSCRGSHLRLRHHRQCNWALAATDAHMATFATVAIRTILATTAVTATAAATATTAAAKALVTEADDPI